MGCVEQPLFKTEEVLTARPTDLPTGIRLGPENAAYIEGAPAAFARFGRGVPAVHALADALGLSTDRVDWDNLTLRTPSTGPFASWSIFPGLDEVDCVCSWLEVVEKDDVWGTNAMGAVLADGQIVQFWTMPWLRPDLEWRVTEDDARSIATAHLAELGLEFWEERRDLSFPLVDKMFLPQSGVAWRLQGTAQGPERTMHGELFIDGMTGAIVHESFHETSQGSYLARSVTDPSLWPPVVISLVAFALTRRFSSG